jgi:hypothetical protein
MIRQPGFELRAQPGIEFVLPIKPEVAESEREAPRRI